MARRVLSNSYAFAYLFFGNDLFREDFSPEANAANQGIFEDCQQQLEAEVRRLLVVCWALTITLLYTYYHCVRRHRHALHAERMQVFLSPYGSRKARRLDVQLSKYHRISG